MVCSSIPSLARLLRRSRHLLQVVMGAEVSRQRLAEKLVRDGLGDECANAHFARKYI